MSEAITTFDNWSNQYRRWLCTPIAAGAEVMQELRFQIFIMSLGPVLQLLEREAETAGIDSTPISRLRGSLNVISQDPERFEAMLDDVWGIVQRLKAIPQETTRHDTKDDTTKKTGNKRKMNVKSCDCARIYRADNGKTPMKTVVEDYVAKHGGSFDSIMRALNDNPDQWKADTKAT